MEIKNSNPAGIRPDASSGKPAVGRESTGGATGKTVSSAPGNDRVTLTDTARQLLGAGSSDGDAPVNRARVDALREAIADGSYKPDAARIASKLLDLDGKL